MKRSWIRPLALLGLAVVLLALGTWSVGSALHLSGLDFLRRGAPVVDLTHGGRRARGEDQPRRSEPEFRLAIAPVVSPERSVELYDGLAGYLRSRLGMRVRIMLRSSYEEVSSLLRHSKCDTAMVCSFPFVQGERDFGLLAIAMPQIRGETTYRSYIIVRASSHARSLSDLRGKRFASASLLSSSGWIYPKHWLVRRGLNPSHFFASHLVAKSHDRAILAVLSGEVDGAAVHSLVFEQMRREHPEQIGTLRILHRSPPFGTPPFVVPRGLDGRIRQRLQEALLSAHDHPEGREALRRLGVDRYVRPIPALYDSARRMLQELEHAR